MNRLVKRMAKSAKCGNLISADDINNYINEHKLIENDMLYGAEKVIQSYTSNDIATSGMFAVDNVDNPTRYFAVDIQQLTPSKRGYDSVCVVAAVELDINGNVINGPVINSYYGRPREMLELTLVPFNTPLQFVRTDSVQTLLAGNFESI